LKAFVLPSALVGILRVPQCQCGKGLSPQWCYWVVVEPLEGEA
jgi:hypothetical protein